MTKDGHAVAVLSGELTVEQRISVLDRFRAGLEKVLITTNVLARGNYGTFRFYKHKINVCYRIHLHEYLLQASTSNK